MSKRKGGRPKTAIGHRDDAAEGLHEGMAGLARFRAHVLANRRREDRILREVASTLLRADGSWRRAREVELTERECAPAPTPIRVLSPVAEIAEHEAAATLVAA